MADVTISPEVRAVLERSTITDNSVKLPPGQLERKLYEGVKKVLEFVGGKWKGGNTQAFVFTGSPHAKLHLTLATGIAVDVQKKFQAFYTPPALAAEVVQLAMVKGKSVLEPSAGQGALVKECLAQGATEIDCVELNPENFQFLKSLDTEDQPVFPETGDFLEYDFDAEKYDRVVMNPPFTRDQDITHVEHALKWLAPGGILVAIMADNESRPKFQALTARLDASDATYSIRKVPEKTFTDTPIRTLILKVKTAATSPATPTASAVVQTKPTQNSSHSIMKLRIKRSELSAALAAVRSASATRATLPILAHVAIVANEKSITLTATNLDLTLRAKVEAVVDTKGEITVPCALLHDIVRSVKGDDVFLELTKKTLHVACGSSKFKLGTLPAEDFPAIPRIKDATELELPQFELRRLLATTSFASGVVKDRPVLNGAFFQFNKSGVTVVGCDGHRVAVDTAASGGPATKFILPAAAVTDLLRLLDYDEEKARPVSVSAGPNGVQFNFSEYTLTSKLIEGNFPDYQKVIPATTAGVTIGRADLLNAVERVSLVGDTCRLEFRGQTLTILSDNPSKDCPGECVESLLVPPCAEATVKLAARFLQEALGAIRADEIEFHVLANGPAVLKAASWLAVIAAKKDKDKDADDKAKAKPEAKPKK